MMNENTSLRTDTVDSRKHRYGVLLLNMGGPRSQAEVFAYLYRLFSDPFILGVPAFLRKKLAFLIARLRKKKAAQRYALIGGKSPLDEETRQQARKLEERLQCPVAYAMRYTEPRLGTARRQLEESGITRLVAIPLYPQFSLAATGSAAVDIETGWKKDIPYRIIENHFRFHLFIETLYRLLQDSLESIGTGHKTAVLFVAHSIPLRQVRRGDPYVAQVKSTIKRVVQRANLSLPYFLAFQSRVGPVKWQGPMLEETLRELLRQQFQQLVVQPVSFAAENLETLYDLDIYFKQQCITAGIREYIRVPAPGSHPLYIDTLAQLVKEEIKTWEAPL